MVKKGDRVKFLNDVGGGIVTGFINKKMVNVENEDGFEVPYPVDQLINVSDPALNKEEKVSEAPRGQEEEPQQAPGEEVSHGQIIPGKDKPDFFFCFVPSDSQNPLTGEIDLFLVNDSNFTLLVYYSHFQDGKYETVAGREVYPNTEIKLESIVQGDLNELPEYCFQILYFSGESKTWHPPVLKKFKMNPVKFYKESSYSPNAFFENNAMVFQISENILDTELSKLTDEDFKKVVKAKEPAAPSRQPVRKEQAQEIIEVDLHIQELLDNATGLSNKEILEIQMEKVEHEMRAAIQSKARRIVFIHGVGQGVLKQEVSKLLKTKFPKYIFQDASFKEYGYGATMVLLRKGK